MSGPGTCEKIKIQNDKIEKRRINWAEGKEESQGGKKQYICRCGVMGSLKNEENTDTR